VTLSDDIDRVYEDGYGPGDQEDCADRHGVQSAGILTIATPQAAELVARAILPFVRGKTVVEIGSGVGFLALELAKHARQVFAIEASPAWSWAFTKHLFRAKPPNLTWIFGAAESVAGGVCAEVAVVRTRSACCQMVALAETFAPVVVLSHGVRAHVSDGTRRDAHRFAEKVDGRAALIALAVMKGHEHFSRCSEGHTRPTRACRACTASVLAAAGVRLEDVGDDGTLFPIPEPTP